MSKLYTMHTLRELINRRNIPNGVIIAIEDNRGNCHYYGTVGKIPKCFDDLEYESATYNKRTKEITVRECA